jgi:hypothetical protein
MALTIVEARAITGGVDTHADTHVAAALDPVGGLLGVREFPVTPAGYAGLMGWLGGFGTVCLVGIEGTGSYGAGLTRHVTAAGVRVRGQRAGRFGRPRPTEVLSGRICRTNGIRRLQARPYPPATTGQGCCRARGCWPLSPGSGALCGLFPARRADHGMATARDRRLPKSLVSHRPLPCCQPRTCSAMSVS